VAVENPRHDRLHVGHRRRSERCKLQRCATLVCWRLQQNHKCAVISGFACKRCKQTFRGLKAQVRGAKLGASLLANVQALGKIAPHRHPYIGVPMVPMPPKLIFNYLFW